MLKLLIEDDEGKQTVVPLIRDEITIGRKEGNTIRLTERNVSRRHARLLKVNGSVYVEDVASRYGTRLNGTKISSREKLNPGDEVEIGDYRLSVQDESKEAQAAAKKKSDEPVGPQPIPAREQGRLVVISSNFAGQEFPLVRTEMVIGRNAECDIVIDHRSISGTHAKIVRGKDKVFKIVDLKSANGVKVNGTPYSVKELHSGEIVELGHVRFRFCAPGELWSFQLAAGLVEDVAPQSSRNSMLLLVAVLILLLVAAGAFFVLQGDDGDDANAATGTAAGKGGGDREIELPSSYGDAEVDGLVLECQQFADKGEFDMALAKCKAALDLRPNSPLIQEKYDRLLVEKTYAQRYQDIKDLIAQGDCAFALIEIEGVDDPNSWAARQLLKEDMLGQATTCIEAKTRENVSSAIKERDWETAQDSVNNLRQLVPKSALIAQLESDIESARKRRDRDDDDDDDDDRGSSSSSKRDDGKSSSSSAGSSKKDDDDGGKDCLADAESDAKQAKGILLGNPSKAAKLLRGALKCEGRAKWRAQYAFALERQGKDCSAYKQYKRAIRGLSGSEAKRAQRSIDKFSSKCE